MKNLIKELVELVREWILWEEEEWEAHDSWWQTMLYKIQLNNEKYIEIAMDTSDWAEDEFIWYEILTNEMN